MTALLSIGELARRTGLSVRTIRFYADEGLVPPAARSDAGYRLFGPEAPARLALVRTLRELGLDLATIRRVLAQELRLADVARAHAAALDAQIRFLRVQRAALQTVIDRDGDAQEITRMTRLIQLSDDERKRLVTSFLDHVFDGLAIDPGFEARMRSGLPSLPDDPTREQLDAWIELAELIADDDFRATIRRLAEQHAAAPPEGPDMRAAAALVAEKAGAARDLAPGSAAAQAVVAELLPAFGEAVDRHALADRLAAGTEPRAERYWQLLATINGWPPVPTTVPAWQWFVAALRAG